VATVNFLYRSTKDRAPLTVRLQFWISEKAYFRDAKTELFVTAKEWELYQKNKNSNNRDAAIKSLKAKITADLQGLEERILPLVNITTPEEITKEWMQNIVKLYYHPELQQKHKEVPTTMVKLLDFYMETKTDVSKDTKKKMGVLRNKLVKFDQRRGRPLAVSEIRGTFASEFATFLKDDLKYSVNTIKRDFGSMVTLCRYAGDHGVDIAPDLNKFKYKAKFDNKYEVLTFEEINRIAEFKGLYESLDNARDWLLISLYCGARMSDFLRFDSSMISETNGYKVLDFGQSKTEKSEGGGKVVFAITNQIQRILDKRGGQFPRKISGQKYNEYMKKVLEKVGFTEEVQGYKKVKISDNEWRHQLVTLPRYKFISSHVGRRSYATNLFSKIPTVDIMNQTGHSSEKIFLKYIQKTNRDRALEIAPKLEALFEQKEEKKTDLLNKLQELMESGSPELEQLLKNLKNT